MEVDSIFLTCPLEAFTSLLLVCLGVPALALRQKDYKGTQQKTEVSRAEGDPHALRDVACFWPCCFKNFVSQASSAKSLPYCEP